ncbi:MAG: ABC transporter ATP-binding protein [Verrucomicrobia bacterium]|nr:ABC transporter ATP-binding protein [Verrucomicrobiota bacterium]MBU6445776.1 ABC transporter ATP-binding protein [Verrucomicrobiota bacterium]MDE3046813.1 ABC transporter ATP-binding protein [Verrucomicrobiota bacterium]
MILQAKNIVKCYDNLSVLSGVSLSIEAGQTIAICGRSGEGKTTLLHILGTLEEPDSGEIELAGMRLSRSNAKELRNQQIGFIFQSYNLLEDFTALENVLMPARIARKQITRSMGLELLARVGLEHKCDVPAKVLSGGERQRVAIARALCNDPPLILADEPTGNLDRENGKKVGELLLQLNKALILVTHDAELAALCHTQSVLKDGKLI